MVRRFSRDPALIARLRGWGLDRTSAADLIVQVTVAAGIASPVISFHGGRGPHTGYCMPPRDVAVAKADERTVAHWEQAKRRRWPEHGFIRLGDPTSAETIAHELGHHYVHVFDRPGTPPHGKVWVGRFDDAAGHVATLIDERIGQTDLD
jgi:hypothetical protein